MYLNTPMISFLLTLTVLVTPTDGSTQSSSYKDVLFQRAISDSAEMLTRQKKYAEAISLFESATLNVDTELTAHLHLAICFCELGKTQKAIKEIKRAFAKGYDIKFVLSQKCFSSIKDELTKHYRKLRPRYLSTIDTALRKELHKMTQADQGIRSLIRLDPNTGSPKRDSIFEKMLKIDSGNISRLKQIVEQRGWPGIKMIGNSQTYRDYESANPSLLVTHAGEAENIYFLKQAIQNIEIGQASWWDAYPIMTNLSFRLATDGFIKMRSTYVDKDGNLDIDRSFFQLKVLSDFLKANPKHKISLFITQYEDEPVDFGQYQNAVFAVRDFLVAEGVGDRVDIDQVVTKVKKDSLGEFRIAYHMSREKK